MLYVDDTAIGYLAHEDTASAQMERVREALRIHEMLDTDATLYRCEHEQIRGDVTYLSADDVYDALFAQATDGYVRAYRLIGDVSSEDGNGDTVGAVTEAEILTAGRKTSCESGTRRFCRRGRRCPLFRTFLGNPHGFPSRH